MLANVDPEWGGGLARLDKYPLWGSWRASKYVSKYTSQFQIRACRFAIAFSSKCRRQSLAGVRSVPALLSSTSALRPMQVQDSGSPNKCLKATCKGCPRTKPRHTHTHTHTWQLRKMGLKLLVSHTMITTIVGFSADAQHGRLPRIGVAFGCPNGFLSQLGFGSRPSQTTIHHQNQPMYSRLAMLGVKEGWARVHTGQSSRHASGAF